jgi:hypothetical protein
MTESFYSLFFASPVPRLGDAIRNAKKATGDLDVVRSWILLGDPSMRVR